MRPGFWCISGWSVISGSVCAGPVVTQLIEPDFLVNSSRAVFVGALLTASVIAPDGRVGRAGEPYDDRALGVPVRPGIRAAVEPPSEASGIVLEGG